MPNKLLKNVLTKAKEVNFVILYIAASLLTKEQMNLQHCDL